MTMSIETYLKKEAYDTLMNYRPVDTESKGLAEVAAGLSSVVYSIIWRMRDSNDLGTGTPIATQGIEIGLVVTAAGLIKLTLPIAIGATYAVFRTWSWVNQ